MKLDLASLASVRKFAAAFLDQHGELHVLCNNAGVMALPCRKTEDGFEMQIGTNHLGHFALTGLLLERLLATPRARVVQSEHRYSKWGAYGQSKLANLLFAYELQRRLVARSAGTTLLSVAVHPGYAATNLQVAGARMQGSSLLETLSNVGNWLIAQSASGGALPTLYAATWPDVRGGDYFGPGGFMEMRGAPKKVTSSARSRDPEAAQKLWSLSERLTGVRYEALSD
jgi:NAD(P)-dependent dehydrogenase (short-subunit alcohol dehydrogenase family)